MSDPFETLGLEPRFELEPSLLESRHRELSRALHPDRYVGRGASERRQALSRAIEVNEALRTLKDPVRRATSLLARFGIEFPEGKEPKASPEFLMDVLELREELVNAQRARDLTSLRRLASAFETRAAATQRELAAAFVPFEKRDSARPSAESAAEFGRLLGELRFLKRLIDEARAIEDELS